MKSQATRYGWVLRLDPGEEVFETLREFAVDRDIRCGFVSGIGSVGEADLGCFVRETRQYLVKRFTGDHEVISLTGNLSEHEGRPFPHCHLAIAGDDFVTYAGHLFRAVVSVTCEVMIITSPDVLRRASRPDLGYHPLEPSGSTGG
jgi:predicted DNA-binding protein with PD1-like motif